MGTITDWTIPGAGGEPIIGNTHTPAASTRGVIVIAHGFKGYKDYGMFPRLAIECADAGILAHRFNFSHSGMTNRLETFQRPDLFERDTWNRQVQDIRAILGAIADGTLLGTGLPYVLFGHSRGGVATLLTAGRKVANDTLSPAAGVVTAAAPSTCNMLPPEEASRLLKEGFLVSPSSRTGQELRVGCGFLQEQIDDPAGHDLPAQIRQIRCPMLVVHGENDPTVPAEAAKAICEAAGNRADMRIVADGDHVFNTPNPMPANAAPSPQLQELLSALVDFAQSVCNTGN